MHKTVSIYIQAIDKINAMQNFNKSSLYLTCVVRFLAGSRFTWLAISASATFLPSLILCKLVPSSYSYGYGFQSKAARDKAISYPKLQTLMQYAS